jgi:uncharacterized membrane protein
MTTNSIWLIAIIVSAFVVVCLVLIVIDIFRIQQQRKCHHNEETDTYTNDDDTVDSLSLQDNLEYDATVSTNP